MSDESWKYFAGTLMLYLMEVLFITFHQHLTSVFQGIDERAEYWETMGIAPLYSYLWLDIQYHMALLLHYMWMLLWIKNL